MKLNRRQFGLMGGVLALGWATGCAPGTGSTPGIGSTPGTGAAPGSGSTTAGAQPAAGPQALRSKVSRGAAGSPVEAGAALNSLGAALLKLMPGKENAVLSPYSIYAVLAMTRAGAKGATAVQLDAVLGAAASQGGKMTAIDRAVAAALVAGKPPAGGDPSSTDLRPVTIEVANSVWMAPKLPVEPVYLDELAAGFGVGMFKIDFAADPEAARQAINGWVAQHTGKLISELIANGVITLDTVLALVNAMRLSAPWQYPFTLTGQPFPFTAAGGSVRATGMGRTGVLPAASGKGWSAVTIPYRGGGLAMTVLLPDRGSFDSVRAQLPIVFGVATLSAAPRPVQVVMPTFKSDSHLSLKSLMKTLGVVDLFDAAADLSGIAGPPGYLMASELIHQSVIEVDEKGTEAAAATALVAVAASAPGGEFEKFTVDRPFFYSVHDTVTGAPLFLGQVTDPTK